VAVEPLVARIGEVKTTYPIIAVPLDRVGDAGGLAPIEQDSNEGGTARLVVEDTVED
jgi:hypothetical protein